jgi:hypothetical protein
MTFHSSPTMLVIHDRRRPEVLVARPRRLRTRILSRLHASSLDRQLADGRAPESSALLAARAEWLVSPSGRRALARGWATVLERAPLLPTVPSPRIPVCGARLLAAEPEVHALIRALTDPLPVPARGAAMAARLLCDGAGPVYDPHCPADLSAQLRAACFHLNPALSLMSDAAGVAPGT